MNIFILHKNPKTNAKYYCDQHVRKMILETAQLLSFAHYRSPSRAKKDKIYKDSKSHGMHPCAIWVRQSSDNYNYLCKIGLALCREYTHRFGKIHKTQAVLKYLSLRRPELPLIPITPFALAMPKEYQFISKIENKTVFRDAVKSYRRYYKAEKLEFKRGPATWTNRKKPPFLTKKPK